MIARAMLEAAKPWQEFQGAAEKPRHGTIWAMFEVDYPFCPDVSQVDRMLFEHDVVLTHHGYASPQIDDNAGYEERDPVKRPNDMDACLAHLQAGGALVFVPDYDRPNEKHGRFIARKPRRYLCGIVIVFSDGTEESVMTLGEGTREACEKWRAMVPAVAYKGKKAVRRAEFRVVEITRLAG